MVEVSPTSKEVCRAVILPCVSDQPKQRWVSLEPSPPCQACRPQGSHAQQTQRQQPLT